MNNEYDLDYGIIQIENFEGPLDLLLSLIKEKKLDIFDVDLSEMAIEYVKIVSELIEKDVDMASDYLVMAAQLINIKAKILLKTPVSQNEAKEMKRSLLDRLSEYQKYKNMTAHLKKMELEGRKHFHKDDEDVKRFQKPVDESLLVGTSSPVKLITALRKMFEKLYSNVMRQTTIETVNLSPAERRMELLVLMKQKNEIKFEDFFSVPTIDHFVITMLTVLDMSRKQEIILEQDEQYGEIRIMKGEKYGQ